MKIHVILILIFLFFCLCSGSEVIKETEKKENFQSKNANLNEEELEESRRKFKSHLAKLNPNIYLIILQYIGFGKEYLCCPIMNLWENERCTERLKCILSSYIATSVAPENQQNFLLNVFLKNDPNISLLFEHINVPNLYSMYEVNAQKFIHTEFRLIKDIIPFDNKHIDYTLLEKKITSAFRLNIFPVILPSVFKFVLPNKNHLATYYLHELNFQFSNGFESDPTIHINFPKQKNNDFYLDLGFKLLLSHSIPISKILTINHQHTHFNQNYGNKLEISQYDFPIMQLQLQFDSNLQPLPIDNDEYSFVNDGLMVQDFNENIMLQGFIFWTRLFFLNPKKFLLLHLFCILYLIFNLYQ